MKSTKTQHKTVTINGVEITAHQLTVREIRFLMEAETIADNDVDMVGDFILPGISFHMLSHFTDVKRGDIENMTPDDISKIGDVIKEVNPGFFALTDRWKEISDSLSPSKP